MGAATGGKAISVTAMGSSVSMAGAYSGLPGCGVRISWPVSVTSTVCSPLGGNTMILGDHGPAVGEQLDVPLPALIIGSMVKIMPGTSSMPVPGSP